MRSHIADPIFPFDRGARGTYTVLSGRDFSDSLAAITLTNKATFGDGVAVGVT